MKQNNKRILILHERWTQICEFLSDNEKNIKNMLWDALDPAMLRAEVAMHKVSHGEPYLTVSVAYPDYRQDSVTVLAMLRPTPYLPGEIKKRITTRAMPDILAGVSNQLIIKHSGKAD